MGFNFQGIACAKKYENAALLLRDIGLLSVSYEGADNFENATSSFIGDNEIFVTEAGHGTIVTFGTDIDIDKLTLDKLSTNANALRFMVGETSGVFAFDVVRDSEIVRGVIHSQGEVVSEAGEPLEIEGRSEDLSDIIFGLIGETVGIGFWEIEPEHQSQRYQLN